MNAISSGQFDIVKLLIENGADLEYKDEAGNHNTSVMWAASKGNIDNVNILLKYKADKNLKNKDGLTTLDLTKNNGQKDISDILEKTK